MTPADKRLGWIGLGFSVFSTSTRIGLALICDERFSLGQWGHFMATGLLFDIAVIGWFLLPWAIYEGIMPAFSADGGWAKWESRWAALWATLYLTMFAVIAAAEAAFWLEFGSRFDFIAVDYLVYTHEVIGNIRESYPVGLWVGIIVVLSAVLVRLTWPQYAPGSSASGWMRRFGRIGAIGLVIFLGLRFIDTSLTETKSSAFVQQLSNNGVYAFGHAFRHNQLDFDKYYPTLKAGDLNGKIRALVAERGAHFAGAQGIERRISAHGKRRNVNVVLISVESLSAEFVGRYGGKRGLTPELDKLAAKGLVFGNLFATGTRTVRGLEALSIGTPPTPGQSIVRRPNNDHLENLGEELTENGWSAYWIYGGYGFFDNMNAYFGANGYRVADRTDIDAAGLPVHAENIWGVADEDLFSLAIKKLDAAYKSGRTTFAHIMTTSNHRPYTFPENRVDLPQKHREGAVKYTDWAIGDFIRRSADKPWFDNTLFILTADHTAKAAGKTDLPLSRYHIPMIWYAPKLVAPGTMDRVMSQIDIGPTLMGWLGLDYSSRFFGYDMFELEAGRERAFISTYQKLGYVKAGRLIVLDVNRPPEVVKATWPGLDGGKVLSDRQLIDEAIAWYQSASQYFRSGQLKDVAD